LKAVKGSNAAQTQSELFELDVRDRLLTELQSVGSLTDEQFERLALSREKHPDLPMPPCLRVLFVIDGLKLSQPSVQSPRPRFPGCLGVTI